MIPTMLTEREWRTDLRNGVFTRLSKAAFAARQAADTITSESGRNADKRIHEARAALDECERYLTAYRDLDPRHTPHE